jgi:hypothetical protein
MQSGQKLTLDLLATITLEVVLFRAYALLPLLNASWKSCSLRVQHCLILYQSQLCQNGFQFYLQSGKQESGWGMTVTLILVKRFLDEMEV